MFNNLSDKLDKAFHILKGHGKITGGYQTNPIKYLLRECDKTSREMQEGARERQNKTNLKFFGSYSLVYEENIISRSVQETIRILDVQKYEEEYVI